MHIDATGLLRGLLCQVSPAPSQLLCLGSNDFSQVQPLSSHWPWFTDPVKLSPLGSGLLGWPQLPCLPVVPPRFLGSLGDVRRSHASLSTGSAGRYFSETRTSNHTAHDGPQGALVGLS